MAGYTPVFDSVFHGTLCGRWPALPVWLTILPMADKNGQIDMTYQAMSALTGWPMDLLKQAINELMQPDPESRSEAHEGRRLVPIDPSRSWGWQVVNHEKYREKARLAAKNASEIQTGKNAKRMQDRRRPPETASDPLSDSNANTDSNTNKEKDSAAPPLADRSMKPEGEMAIAMRDLGVRCTSMDETLLAWVRDGFTVQQVSDAVALARMRKPYPEPIPVNYVDPILRKPQRPPPNGVNRITWRPPPDDDEVH